MSSQPETYLPTSDLGLTFYSDFNDLLDFIWKLPEFVEQQRLIELNKLEIYFPFSGDADKDQRVLSLRNMRTSLHHRRLNELFPDALATSSFLMGVSWHERNLLLLCKKISAKLNINLGKNHGVGGLWKFLQKSEIPIERSRNYAEVKIAYDIRNCFIHAGGLLEFSNSAAALRSIVNNKTYLPIRLRTIPQGEHWNPNVDIASSELGETIRLSGNFSYYAANILKENVCDLCDLSTSKY